MSLDSKIAFETRPCCKCIYFRNRPMQSKGFDSHCGLKFVERTPRQKTHFIISEGTCFVEKKKDLP